MLLPPLLLPCLRAAAADADGCRLLATPTPPPYDMVCYAAITPALLLMFAARAATPDYAAEVYGALLMPCPCCFRRFTMPGGAMAPLRRQQARRRFCRYAGYYSPRRRCRSVIVELIFRHA